MKNKEIKKGGQIWICTPFLRRTSSCPVISVKKAGTLVTVVIRCMYFDKKEYEVTLYGHANSSMLSGYDRKFNFGQETYYTCDFDIIEKWTKERNTKSKYEEIGRNLKCLLNSLEL